MTHSVLNKDFFVARQFVQPHTLRDTC